MEVDDHRPENPGNKTYIKRGDHLMMNGTSVGQIFLLGDPGTAKSQFLKIC
jgi:hypothetical protein